MKSTKSFFAANLLGLLLAVSVTPVSAQGVVGNAILGGAPYAIDNYGANVLKGRAELISPDQGSRSRVVVKITGLQPGTTHIGHIHGGSCVRLTPGTIFHNLEPVVADQNGVGISRTEIPEGIQSLADCEWWVAFHEGAENSLPQSPVIVLGPVIINSNSRSAGGR